jgi:hypothetical protein
MSMKRMLVPFITAVSLIAGCTTKRVPEAQCGPRPSEQEITSAVQSYIQSVNWKDPDSVRFRNVTMQSCRAIYNGLVNGGGYTTGWEIDFEINAKNSYGGYTGFETKSVIRASDGTVHWQIAD